MKKRLSISLVFMIIGVVSLIPPLPALAAGTVGDGTPGSCTEAALDSSLAGGGLVDFNCGKSTVTITLTSQKTISADTIIDGADLVILSGGNLTGLFLVNSNHTLILKNLTITNGNNNPGGAINNQGTVLITNTYLTDNSASGGIAGAIYNNGTLTITNGYFSNNFASAGLGGAIYNETGGMLNIINSSLNNNSGGLAGGGIVNSGTAMITSSTFTANTSSTGGAISNGGSLTIRGCYFNINTTTGSLGGGIYSFGSLMISNSTFYGNSTIAGQRGGGIFNEGVAVVKTSTFINNAAPGSLGGGIYNIEDLTISDDTFFDNSSIGGLGGGIYSESAVPMTITNSTFSNNNGGFAGGGLDTIGPVTIINTTFMNNSPDGLANAGSDTVSIKNTILAGSSTANCNGSITSLGYNLEDGSTCSLSEPGDLSNTDPFLGALLYNGGPTPTHALLSGSPAINAGTNAGCSSTDQRGVTRPLFGTCDIGAYEYGFLIRLPLIGK